MPGDLEEYRVRELVRILGERWGRLGIVRDAEIEAIQQVVCVWVPIVPPLYLRHGQRVRMTRGPLTGVAGSLVRTRPNKGLLTLAIGVLQGAVAVEMDCTSATAG